MNTRQVNVILLNGQLPLYATTHSAGADLYSANEEPITLEPGDIKIIPTGQKWEIPVDAEAQIRPRSGLSAKSGIIAIFGTIDSDYQGEVGIILHNAGEKPYVVNKGERLAQAVFNGAGGLFQADWNVVSGFERESERGEGGFGHTGTN